MLKKILLSAVILLIFTNVKASAGALINADVERVIGGLQRVCNNTNISLWGKSYLTIKDSRICVIHWGNSKNNTVVFQLGSNNNVQRAFVSFPYNADYDSMKSIMASSVMYSSILIMAGLTNNEIENWNRRFFDDIMAADNYAEHFYKKYPLWSSQTQRNITVEFLYKNNAYTFSMYES